MIKPQAEVDVGCETKAREFRAVLEDWFPKNARTFPWRKCQNFFHLLVAELLLRKTQAERVAPIFRDFCERYKDPRDVLAASPETLLELLGELGLKQRVHWLIELSKQLVEQYGGKIPKDYERLCRLKGIGPYTANMVLCLGRAKAHPPVDNNIARLVSRVFNVKRVGDTRREKHVQAILQEVFREGDPRQVTLAMLDVGGIICTAHKPRCTSCPLKHTCSFNFDSKTYGDLSSTGR